MIDMNQTENLVKNIPSKLSQVLLALIFIFCFHSTSALSQANLTECDELVCNGDLQISLNVACELLLTADMLLEATLPGDYTVKLFDAHGDFLRDSYLLADDAGTTVKYQISCGGNSCWGEIIVEANVIPIFDSPCAATEDGSIPEDCILWCGPVGKVPASLVTPEEVAAAFGHCGPDLLGDLKVTETRTGDICSEDGEVVELVYTGKVIQHGSIRTVEILTQRYSTQKLTVDAATFNFPQSLKLDCDYLDQIEQPEGEDPIHYELGEPASIYASEHDKTVAYPYYIDIHDTILNVVTIVDSNAIVISQMLRDTMVKEFINGEELWVLVTIVDKVYEYEYTTSLDTIGKTNPIVPVIDRVCNVLSGYSDIQFDACGQGQKIIRTWNLIDWCNADVSITGTQTIEIQDITAPSVVEKVDGKYVPVTMLSDVSISTDPWSCSAKFKLPSLTVQDNCDLNPDVSWDSNEGVVVDGYLVDLWLGQSPIAVVGTVTDDCGNSSDVTFNIIVVDDVPPVPVCETSLQVSLTGNASGDYGIAKVFAADLDEGSHDSGCGKVEISAVRLEDWREIIRDCQDEVVGYRPKSCQPLVDNVDLGEAAFKNNCDRNGNNIDQVTVAGDFVTFCCEDFGQIVQVILFVKDEQGNINQCIVDVEVVDKSAPSLFCEDLVISCADGDYLSTPAMIGSSCSREEDFEILLLSESRSNNVCAGGQTVREWYIDTDQSGDFSPGDAFCQQIVRVDADTAFNPYTIKWPKNYDGKQVGGINIEVNDEGKIVEIPTTVDMGDPAACTPDDIANGNGDGANDDTEGSEGLGIPVWCDTECGLVGYSMESDTIKASEACLKIIRRWTIVDWCTYDPNGNNLDDENDLATDSFEAIEDWAQFEPNSPSCPTYAANIGDAVYYRYSSVDRDGYYTYDQVIVVNDDTAPEIDGPASYVVNTTGGATSKDGVQDCTGSEVITAYASDLCGGEMTGSDLLQWQITVSKDGQVVANKTVRGAEASMNSQVGSPGDTHVITWRVKDGCGNATTAQTIVTFGDQAAPTPFCVAGLTTAFMSSDGSVAVWGEEFDFGSFDNCTATEDLRFSLVRKGEEAILPGAPGFEDQKGITFHCSDYSSFSDLDVYVWDLNGNGDYCSVAIVISDNGDTCPELQDEEEEVVVEEEVEEEEQGGASGVILSGQVQTSYGMMIGDVQVQVNSASLPEYPLVNNTTSDGEFVFTNNPIDYNYVLSASKEDEYMAGVSTLDLVMISRHIVDIEKMDDPFTILAADATGDGRVSAVDLSALKRLILGNSEDLTNSPAWLFVDANQAFFDNSSPWPFSENVEINSVSEDMENQNFIGVKVGDVNQSMQSAETRSTGLLTFETENRDLRSGQLINVDFKSSNFSQISGYQMTLNHENLEFVSIQSNALAIDESNLGIRDGRLAMNWFDAGSHTMTNNEVLFSLTFKALKNTDLETALSFGSSVTKSEAYVGDNHIIYDVALNIVPTSIDYQLSQNHPNPFSSNTTIEFNLPSSDKAVLSIFDVNGKKLKSFNQIFNKGLNQVKISADELNSNGLLYYQLESSSFTDTKRMILLNN